MFKECNKIVCINDYRNLKAGRIYYITRLIHKNIYTSVTYYHVLLDDIKLSYEISDINFILLSEYRKLKLKKLMK